MSFLREFLYRLRGEYTTEKLISMGMTVGKNFGRLNGVILDPSHCWLITIGDNVTMAPRVHILCHDASTKGFLGYTKIGRVNHWRQRIYRRGVRGASRCGYRQQCDHRRQQHRDARCAGQYSGGGVPGLGNLLPGRVFGKGAQPHGHSPLLWRRIHPAAECIHGKAPGTESCPGRKDRVY